MSEAWDDETLDVWDEHDIQEHDECMSELREMPDDQLVTLALGDPWYYHPEEIRTEIDRRLELSLNETRTQD